MVSLLFDLLKTARPRQWVKNLTLYAGLIFTGYVFTADHWIIEFWKATEAIVVFTIVAIAIYFFNDLKDIKADKAHPFKKNRPIAAGRVSPAVGWIMFGLLTAAGLLLAKTISELFFLTIVVYYIMQILYTLWLKNIEVVDVYIIAIGFFLRVFAGSVAVNTHLSIWFLLCVVSTSLFLAVGKRRAELAILTEKAVATVHRKVMGKYTANILDSYLAMFATAAFLSWALYTFNFYEQADVVVGGPVAIIASKTLTINKWLMATIPVVIFGIMRYLRIVYDGSKAETPERVMLSDMPLLISVTIWGILVMAVLYWLPK